MIRGINVLNRRKFLASIAMTALMKRTSASSAPSSKVLLGAIRWDPWYAPGSSRARQDVERTLGPKNWHFRAPACSLIEGESKISFSNCDTQSEIDQEIVQASQNNIDYWAYVWYRSDSDLQQSWRLHQSSSLHDAVRWCMILSSAKQLEEEYKRRESDIVHNLSRYNYQTVLDKRPLIYMFQGDASNEATREILNRMRPNLINQGLSNPYIVLLAGGHPNLVEACSVDAVGIYSKERPAPVAGAYSDLVKLAENYWGVLADSGQPMIPTALTGADRRPRVEHPVSWEKSQKLGEGYDRFYARGTPKEISVHVTNLVRWIKAHPKECPAQAGLIYSWSEYDEGGSTLGASISDGYSNLQAVGQALER